MKIKIKNKFLVFPVNQRMTKKRIYINDGVNPAYALNIKLDNLNPDFYAYVNVERFKGKTVDVYSDNNFEIKYTKYTDDNKINISTMYGSLYVQRYVHTCCCYVFCCRCN